MAARGLIGRGFAVLMYHGIARAGEERAVPGRERKFWVRRPDLRAHLVALREAGHRFAGLHDAWQPEPGGRPRPPVALTFDDGRATDYEAAFPLLLELGAPADFFVNTAIIGTPGYLTWPQIVEMHGAGMAFQSHGHDHVSLPALSRPALARQLGESKLRLEDRVGARVEFLAVPYGLVDSRVVSAAREQGYAAVCTSRPWPARPGDAQIDRFVVYGSTSARCLRRVAACRPGPYLARALRGAALYVPKHLMGKDRSPQLDARIVEAGP